MSYTAVVSKMGDDLPGGEVASIAPRTPKQQKVIASLQSYINEAEEARRSGDNPRDEAWDENLRRYWSRYDFGDKAGWQAQEVLPEFSSFVDRFAAAIKEAWLASGFATSYTVEDPGDTEHDLTDSIKRMMDVWLSTCATNPQGHPLGFEAILEEQAKMAALMSTCACVVWKDDVAGGRVAVESVDPRHVWLDGTGRGLYRIRRIEMDRHKLEALAKQKDKKGRPLYNLNEVERLTQTWLYEEKKAAESLSGYGAQHTSNRRALVLHEILGDIIGPAGEVLAEKALTTLADMSHVIRGPEKNPFWHQRDWIVMAPLITVPLSVYGRSYAEDFGALSDTFTKVTNLLLDAVALSSTKVFAMIPEMLRNPGQAETGVWPGKTFFLEAGLGGAKDFMHAIDMGTLGSDTVTVWQMIKQEMTEAAGVNEIGLGQFAPKGRTSATEISETQQSSSALVRSVAQTMEQRFIEPVLNLVWKTGIQNMKKDDAMLAAAAGEEMFAVLASARVRKQLASRPITFQARGISALIAKGQKLRALLQVLQVVASNEMLLQQFMQVVDLGKLVDLLFDLSNIDMRRLTLTEREKMMRDLAQSSQMGMGGGGAPPPGGNGSMPAPQQAADVAQMMGVGQ